MPALELVLAQLATLDHGALQIRLDRGRFLSDQKAVHHEQDPAAKGDQDCRHHGNVGQQQSLAKAAEDHVAQHVADRAHSLDQLAPWPLSTLSRR